MATILPSGLNTTDLTQLVCSSKVMRCFWLSTSQSFTVEKLPAQESLEKDYSRVDMVLKSAMSTLLFFINLSGGKYGYESARLLFRLTSRFLKYFALGLFGLAIAYLMSVIFGSSHIAMSLLPFVLYWVIFRCGLILLCLILTTVVFESVH